MRIVITCGYPTSLHAISLIEMAARQGHTVQCCLMASLFNWKRIRHELRQNGFGYLHAKIRNRLVAKPHHPDPELDGIKEFMASNQIGFTEVREACASVGAVFLTVPDLNHHKALAYLYQVQPDLIIYAGGGILRRQFLAIPKIGTLNAHSGPLPHFRGMNAVEWTVFYGINPMITTHFIDSGIDTGPILERVQVKVDEGDTLVKVRGKAIVLGAQSILKTLPILESGNYQPVTQEPNGGRQFFRMSPELAALAEMKLAEKPLREYSPSSFDFAKVWFQ
jgi:methionyl-tRNA formyltransferase